MILFRRYSKLGWIGVITVVFILVVVLNNMVLQSPNNKPLPAAPITDTSLSADQMLTNRIDSFFKQMVKIRRLNGAVLVAKNGKILYRNAAGYANIDQKDTLTTESVFQLASVSKQFTAVAIMMLRERGLLMYDDTVTRFLKDFPYRSVTIRHLLTHRSGIPDYLNFWERLAPPDTPFNHQTLLYILKTKTPPTYFSANTGFSYSNTNYVLLASVVEHLSGKTFAQFMHDEVFSPLGMTKTFIYEPSNDTLQKIKGMTKCYTVWNRPIEGWIFDGTAGDKNVYSTLNDLFIWDQALYEGKLINTIALEEAFKYSGPTRVRNYGFGFRLLKLPDGSPMVYHGGWWRGYNTLFIRVPTNRATLIFLSNRRTNSFFWAYNQLLNMVLPEVYPKQNTYIAPTKIEEPATNEVVKDSLAE